MANTINIPKSHLIMGLSLPLAVLIGYFLAEPLDLSSMAVVFTVLGILCIPLIMKWYYPVLVFSWNATIVPAMLPGSPNLWSIIAFVGLVLAILTRAVNPKARFIWVPSLTRPLLLLTAVTIITALLTGGFGAAALGSSHYGGGRYFALLSAIAGYFVLTSRRIPPGRARLYVACFFLSGLTGIMGNFAAAAGPSFHFLFSIFSSGWAQEQLAAQSQGVVHVGMMRINGLMVVGVAIYSYLLARYGLRGLLDLKRPWRLAFFMAGAGAGIFAGFRSYVVMLGLTLIALFIVEGLHRTRYLPALLGGLLLGCLIVLPQANRLPLPAQRALCFLPGRFDAMAMRSAESTLEWRFEMWKDVLPEVPHYLFRGKGFGFESADLYMAAQSQSRFQSEYLAGTITVGDYHNGPLSVIIPLGIYGLIAVVWFLFAGVRVLYRNYKAGNPEYRNVNALMLAAFIARVVFFFTAFGALTSDLAFFVGILGMSVALNGTDALQPTEAEQPAVGVELGTEYIRA